MVRSSEKYNEPFYEQNYNLYAPIVKDYLKHYYPLVTEIKQQRKSELEEQTALLKTLENTNFFEKSNQYRILSQNYKFQFLENGRAIASQLDYSLEELSILKNNIYSVNKHLALLKTNYYDVERKYPLERYIGNALKTLDNNFQREIVSEYFGFYSGQSASWRRIRSYQELKNHFPMPLRAIKSNLHLSIELMQKRYFQFHMHHRFLKSSWLSQLHEEDK